MTEYDENKAVDYINAQLGERKYPMDEILNIIDMIWDYYESNGMLEIDDDADDDENLEEQLVDYVKTQLARDKEANVDQTDVPAIVKAELDYELSLEE